MEQAGRKPLVNRQGEQGGSVPPRRRRVFMKCKQWYFLTRNGLEHGPYQNLTEAKQALALFLRRSGFIRFTI